MLAVRSLTPEQALGCATGSHFLATPGPSITGVADRIVGLHNTSQVSPYLSLRARLEQFDRSDLESAMWERWALARFRAMRLTMFIFPGDLLEIAAAATRHIVEPLAARWLRDSGLTRREVRRLESAVAEALQSGPLTSRQLRQTLEVPQEVDLPGVVIRLCEQGKVVGGAPPRNWRSNVRRFHLWEHALSDVDIHRWDETAAIAELVRRYVAGYGPVTLSDISWWTGFTKARCSAALDAMGNDIVEVAVDGWSGPLFLHCDADVSVIADGRVNVLPLLDPYVQGYRDRGRLLDHELHRFVWDGGGNSTATLAHRGRIVGVWQLVPKAAAVRYHVFQPLDRALLRRVEEGLDDAGRLYFDERVDVVPVPKMEPLTGPAGARSAMHPLDDVLHRAR